MRKAFIPLFLLLAVQFAFGADTLSGTEGEQSVSDTIIKRLIPGQLTPCCLPFDVDTTLISQLYRVARIDVDGTAYVYPVCSVPAGSPFVAQSTIAIDTFIVADSLIRQDTRIKWMIPWDGGDILCEPELLSWQYCSLDSVWHTADQLVFTVLDPHDLQFTVNLENLPVRRFLQDTYYDESAPTVIGQYLPYLASVDMQGDHPNPVTIPLPVEVFSITDMGRTIDSLIITIRETSSPTVEQMTLPLSSIAPSDPVIHINNLIPQSEYDYEIRAVYGAMEFLSRVTFPIVDSIANDTLIARGAFRTDGHVRMIAAPDARNIRDLGGRYTTSGQMVKYGKLYRGGELNGLHTATTESVDGLKALGIGANISAFGFIANDDQAPDGLKTYYYTNNSGCEVQHMDGYFWKTRWCKELEYILKSLQLQRPVYFHCIWGADRTGFLTMLIYGILGVPYNDIAKDYELTSFTVESPRAKERQLPLINFIEKLKGETLQEKFNYYLTKKLYVTQEVIEGLTDELLDNTPTTLGVSTQLPSQDLQPMLYDLQGRPLHSAPAKGIFIQVDQQGASRKVFFRD